VAFAIVGLDAVQVPPPGGVLFLPPAPAAEAAVPPPLPAAAIAGVPAAPPAAVELGVLAAIVPAAAFTGELAEALGLAVDAAAPATLLAAARAPAAELPAELGADMPLVAPVAAELPALASVVVASPPQAKASAAPARDPMHHKARFEARSSSICNVLSQSFDSAS
jgi:hypothetical protein